MSYRLARFREPMFKVAKKRRKLRRKTNGRRCRFSHISLKGEVYFRMTKTGEIYTQSDLKTFFGVVVKIPAKIRQRAEERRIEYAATQD